MKRLNITYNGFLVIIKQTQTFLFVHAFIVWIKEKKVIRPSIKLVHLEREFTRFDMCKRNVSCRQWFEKKSSPLKRLNINL